jgi:uncharacterized protein
MRIIAVTDIHGEYSIVEDILRLELPDLLLIGGDLTTFGSVEEATKMIAELKHLVGGILAVAGNMDSVGHDAELLRIGVSINARGEKFRNVGFFGVSSAPISPLKTPYEITEMEIRERILCGYKDVIDAPQKVLVSHAPPYGTRLDIIWSGAHVGSKSVREFIGEEEPDLVICGHIHEAKGIDKIKRTKIVNCGSAAHGNYAFIEIIEDIIEVHLRNIKVNK